MVVKGRAWVESLYQATELITLQIRKNGPEQQAFQIDLGNVASRAIPNAGLGLNFLRPKASLAFSALKNPGPLRLSATVEGQIYFDIAQISWKISL